jgi:5-methylcytosine-specific restriction endonuclease McrA
MRRAEHNSRPGRKSLRGRLSARVVSAIIARDNGRCVYCGSADNLHFDHVVPRSLGGDDTPSNLVLACRRCNCKRK